MWHYILNMTNKNHLILWKNTQFALKWVRHENTHKENICHKHPSSSNDSCINACYFSEFVKFCWLILLYFTSMFTLYFYSKLRFLGFYFLVTYSVHKFRVFSSDISYIRQLCHIVFSSSLLLLTFLFHFTI